jgi:hypothetical protein
VSDYGLDDRAIGVRSPAGTTDFSCILCVQTGSGAHPAFCPMGTGGSFPGGKARPGRNADHSPPSSAEVVNEELYLLSPQAPPWRVVGQLLSTVSPRSLASNGHMRFILRARSITTRRSRFRGPYLYYLVVVVVVLFSHFV